MDPMGMETRTKQFTLPLCPAYGPAPHGPIAWRSLQGVPLHLPEDLHSTLQPSAADRGLERRVVAGEAQGLASAQRGEPRGGWGPWSHGDKAWVKGGALVMLSGFITPRTISCWWFLANIYGGLKWGYPKIRMEHPIKMNDLGVPLFLF